MTEIIDLQKVLQEKQKIRLENIKKALDVELDRLDYDMEKELNKYVIFNNTEYYDISKEEDVVFDDDVVKTLLTALDMLVKLNKQNAVADIENIITRLKNNSY
jgi:hypothetical protein|tara:strand:+ start:509 stop:817 length:309 start_codon:yes stop_codon:yes gene_type:complete